MDQKKIILMSKLAIEEKQWIKQDKKITSYYPEDYIYINNFRTRALVICMVGMIMLVSIFLKIQAGGAIPTTALGVFVQYVIPYGLIMLVIIVLYSLFSRRIYAKKYRLAEKRMNKYKRHLRELEEHEARKLREKGGVKGEIKRKYFNA